MKHQNNRNKIKMPKKQQAKKFNPIHSYSNIRLLNISLIFAIIGVLYLVFAGASPIPGFYGSVEKDQVDRMNIMRNGNGVASLHHIECLNGIAEIWTKKMADAGGISHNPNLSNEITYACGSSWKLAGENVGVGYGSSQIFDAFWASPPHRANILDSRFIKTGVGAYWSSSGKLWVTQVFATCVNCNGNWSTNASLPSDPTSPPAATGNAYFIKNSNSSGVADLTFSYGNSSDKHIVCDWNGDGKDTIGIYRGTSFYLSNNNSTAELVFGYGASGDLPICGDWDGDGTDTIGVYRPSNSTFYMRNANSSGGTHITAHYGVPGDKPIIGDWDGDGKDTIGITRGTSFYLRNSNTGGNADLAFGFGGSGDVLITGDWDGNGTDTIGVYRPSNSTFYLRNANSSGGTHITAGYGGVGDVPVIGDWDGNRTSTIGIRR